MTAPTSATVITSDMASDMTTDSSNTIDTAAPRKGPPPDVYLRTVKSYVLRAGRTTIGQAKAYDIYGPTHLLNYTAQALDTEAAFGRLAPVILEIGFGMG